MWGFVFRKPVVKARRSATLGLTEEQPQPWEGTVTLHTGSCLACLAFQSQAVVTGEPLWASHMEFSSWSLTQFLAIIQSLWVRLWNSRKVRRERGLLKLEGARFPAA